MNWMILVNIALALWGWHGEANISVTEATDYDGPGWIAFAAIYPDSCVIGLFPSRWGSMADAQQIIDHEVGHCLGLDHIEGSGIMRARVDPDAFSPSVNDWWEFRRVHPLQRRITIPQVTTP